MSYDQIIEQVEKEYTKKKIPDFRVGDTVEVHSKVIEGKKERIQVFTGVVIARKGRRATETFSVFKKAHGCTVEKVFPIYSPRIVKINVVSSGKVRRAKLYYLRKAIGKAGRVKEKIFIKS